MYVLGRGVIGFKDFTPTLHKICCDFLQVMPSRGGPPESRAQLLKMPREHFKSSMASVTRPVYLLIDDPQATIVLDSAKRRNTRKWMTAIRRVFQENDVFQWLFPELIPNFSKTRWDKDEIIIQRDESLVGDGIIPEGQASVTATSIESGQASGHFLHRIDDDLIDETTYKTPSEVDRAKERYVLHESTLNDVAKSTLCLVGTPWRTDDVVCTAEETEVAKGLMRALSFSCYDEQGEPIFPERFSKERLKALEVKYGPTLFASMYLCDPTKASVGGFNVDALRYYKLLSDYTLKCDCHPDHVHRLSDAVVTMQMDPAYSDDDEAAETAIVTNCFFECDCRFVLDVWSDRVNPDVSFNKMIEIALKYTPFLSAIGIESVAGSKIYKYWLEFAQRHGVDLGAVRIELLPPDTRIKKTVRIKGQQIPVMNGLWHILPGMTKFVSQFRKFPQTRPIDIMDAWGWCDPLWEIIGLPPTAGIDVMRGPDKNMLQQLIGAQELGAWGYN